jgi:eukaryotic-like serine/threonine-protein kinase
MTLPSRIGRYRILELLGQGAMGVVYRGRDEGLDRDVAVKVVRGEALDDEGRAQFQKEARAAARLQHPNIVTVYELGEEEGAPFMAMELLEGEDLQHAMRDGALADPARALPIIDQVLAGLGHAHARGIVHRDMKPSNVFLLQGHHVKILDFGVARLSEGLTVTGRVVGTPHYMSPEQIRADPVDGRSDLFSTAHMFYEMVTGAKAYRPGSAISVMFQIVHEDADLSRLPATPQGAALLPVLTWGLARDREDRYPDAAALAAALSEAVRTPEGERRTSEPVLEIATVASSPSRDFDLAAARLIVPPAESLADTDLSIASSRTQLVEAGPVELPAGRRGATGAIVLVLVLSAGAGVWWWVSQPYAGPPASGPPATLAEEALPATVPTLVPSAAPEPSETLAPSVSPLEAQPAASVAPTTLPSVAPRPQAPTPAPTLRAPAEPRPSRQSSAAPVDALTRLDRANELFQAGRLGAALTEARAILRDHPENTEAKDLVEDIELDLEVEKHLKNARAALARGDRETALREVEEGLRIKPNESRLIALLRDVSR